MTSPLTGTTIPLVIIQWSTGLLPGRPRADGPGRHVQAAEGRPGKAFRPAPVLLLHRPHHCELVEAAWKRQGCWTRPWRGQGPRADLTPKEVEEHRKAATYRADWKQLVALGPRGEITATAASRGGPVPTEGRRRAPAPQLAAFLDGALLTRI